MSLGEAVNRQTLCRCGRPADPRLRPALLAGYRSPFGGQIYLGGTASWTADVAKVGGWVAILDGFAVGYLGAAIVLNVTLARELLPMWPAKDRPRS